MNDNTSIAIVFSMFFLSVGGCCTMEKYQDGLTQREVEKTKQIQIQSKIDSIKATKINKQL